MYFSAQLYRILIVGEEKSGKTVISKIYITKILWTYKIKTYFEHLKHKFTGRGTPLDSIIPTTGLNRKEIIYLTQFPN